MSLFYTLIGITIVLLIIKYTSNVKFSKYLKNPYVKIIFFGLIIRLIAGKFIPSYENDISGFKTVADTLVSENAKYFYENYNYSNYPPFYLYVLYFIGLINSFLKFDFAGNSYSFLIKLPAILADLISAVYIYKIAFKRTSEKNAGFIALAYVLNPAVILISSVWGQYDSIHILLLLISVYNLVEKDFFMSSVFFALAVQGRPINIIFLPVFIIGIIEHSYKKSGKRIFRDLVLSVSSFAITFFLLLLPFTSSFEFKKVIGEILGNELPYASVNAYNLYASMGLNWANITETAFLIPLSNLLFTLIIGIAIIFLIIGKGKYKYYLAIAFINTGFCLLTLKIHERYLFTSLIFLLIAFIYKRDKKILFLYGGFSITFLINCVDILYVFLNNNNYDLIEYQLIIFSLANLILFGYLFLTIIKYLKKDKNVFVVENKVSLIYKANYENVIIEESEPIIKFSKRDFLYITLITLVYGIVAFINLGNKESATSFFEAPENKNTEIIIELDEPTNIRRIQLFLGPRNDKKVIYSMSSDKENWVSSEVMEYDSVFAWKNTHSYIKKETEATKSSNEEELQGGETKEEEPREEEPREVDSKEEESKSEKKLEETKINLTGKYLKIEFLNKDDKEKLYVMEMAIRDEKDNIITFDLNQLDENEKALFDEQDLVPDLYNYMNSTYFDEVYYPRTSYEITTGLHPYEWTHPQLGKVFQVLGVKIFGMNPFGWRFSGTLFGVLMVPLMYLFAKRMFRNSNWALFATIIFAFDFMHYTQTRIATIDTYITFFVIAMYYYMYKYYKMSFYDTPLYKTLIPLFFSGLFMGMGIASKWPGVYAGIGLAIIFFYTLYKRYREYMYAKDNDISHIKEKFWKNFYITGACCIVFFIVIPVIIYFASYYQYYVADKGSDFYYEVAEIMIPNEPAENLNLIKYVLGSQQKMFGYHSHLNDTHPYASAWWKWLLDIRPIAYYFGDVYDSTLKIIEPGLRGGINAFGNPAVWWCGLVGLFYGVSVLTKRKSPTVLFILISYLAQLLPWILIKGRTTFIYHYFPAIPFLVFGITYFFKDYIWESLKHKKLLTFGYIGLVLILFIGFYPVISGTPVNMDYINSFLRWFPTWWII